MSLVPTKKGEIEFEAAVLDQIESISKRYGVEMERISMGRAFRKLIENLHDKYGPAAVLIDEYDKPILDAMGDAGSAARYRELLREFYIQVKGNDKYIRFVFITGITKFSKMGVFSGLNNLEDISMNAGYSTMLGYTEKELADYFGGYIGETARYMGLSEDELLGGMKQYYDGFSFDGEHQLYNPFSTLLFFKNRAFKNFWFESGTPSFLAKFMKDKKLTVDEFRGMNVSGDFASSPGEIESASPAGFLYQAGYLSLRPGTSGDFSLDYPNREVLVSMSALLSENILGSSSDAYNSSALLRQALLGGDAPGVIEELNRLLASIPYDDYAAAAKRTVKLRGFDMGAGEWLYRSTLLSYLTGVGLDVEAEPHSSMGRADLRIKFKNRVWVIEIKIARLGDDAAKLADEAMGQIMSKGYGARYENPALLAIVIDDGKRSITEYRA
jgi:hypothetical protein